MLKIRIDWSELRSIAKQTPENYSLLLEHAKQNELRDLVPLEDILVNKGYCAFEGWVNSVDDLPDWMLKKCYFERPTTMKLIKPDGAVNINSLVEAVRMNQVHLPDNKLLQMKILTVEENACTDNINERLKDGWQIIAVCLQPGQRRPDYILGKI